MFHSPDGSGRQIRGRLNLGCNKREQRAEYNCNVEKIVLSENTNYNKSLNYELAQQISPSFETLRLLEYSLYYTGLSITNKLLL